MRKMRLIDSEALYKYICKLEDKARKNLNKCVAGTDKWMYWNTILNERTAFKYNILDAPKIEAEPVKHAEWYQDMRYGYWCSECDEYNEYQTNYCSTCGAKMRIEKGER